MPQPFGEGSEGSRNVEAERSTCELFENVNRPVSGQRRRGEVVACSPVPGQHLELIGKKSAVLDEQFFDGLLCEPPMRVERFCFGKSTF